MSKIPSELKAKITSTDSREREQAARDLGAYPGPEPLRLLKRMLSDPNPDVTYAASRALISAGSAETAETLMPLLRSQEAGLRNRVVDIIAKIGPAALAPATVLLHDRDKDVRKFAVDILLQMNRPETEDPLIQALFDDNVNVAVAAAEALGRVGSQRCLPYLIESLEKEPWMKCAALKSLGEIGGETALQAILATDVTEESIVLFTAVTALGTLGDSRGIDFLITLLEMQNTALEPAIIQAIQSIFSRTYKTSLKKVQKNLSTRKIITLLKSHNPGVVRSAIGLLGLLQEETAVAELARLYTESNKPLFEDLEEALLSIKPATVAPLLQVIESDKEPQSVKISVLNILGKIGRKAACSRLIAFLKTCAEELQPETMLALGALKDDHALEPMHTVLQSGTEAVKVTAIEALESFRNPSSIPYLLALADAAAATVRTAAAKSLQTYDLKEYQNEILKMLRNPVPQSAAFALEAIPDTLAPQFTQDILRLCGADQPALRRQAVAKTGALKNSRAFKAAVKALGDPEPQVRLAAIRSLENYPHEDVGQLFLETAASDPAEWNRYEAVCAAGRLGLAECIPAIVLLLKSGPDLVKAAALDVLGELGSPQHVKIVAKHLDSENDLVRDASATALKKLRQK